MQRWTSSDGTMLCNMLAASSTWASSTKKDLWSGSCGNTDPLVDSYILFGTECWARIPREARYKSDLTQSKAIKGRMLHPNMKGAGYLIVTQENGREVTLTSRDVVFKRQILHKLSEITGGTSFNFQTSPSPIETVLVEKPCPDQIQISQIQVNRTRPNRPICETNRIELKSIRNKLNGPRYLGE
jgi:hypothetical protein